MAAAAASLAQRFGDKPEALLALAAERRWQGKTAEAAERFKKCLATEPRCADAYVGLALLADQTATPRLPPSGHAARWRSIQTSPRCPPACPFALEHGRVREGYRSHGAGGAAWSAFPMGVFLLGQAYSQTSAFEKARGAFERAVEMAPFPTPPTGSPSLAPGWGETRKPARYREKFNALKEQDQKQQRDDLRRAKDLPAMRRGAAGVLVRVGQVYAKYDDRSAASAAFGRALELESDHPEAGTAYATLQQAR